MYFNWQEDSKDSRFLILSIQNEEWKRVWKTLFLPHLPSLSSLDSLKEFEERFAALEAKLCKGVALRLLSLKGRFEKELREKLLVKCFSEEAVDKALFAFRQLGYLNDAAEACRLVERLQRKGYGPRLIAKKLQEKGIDAPPSLSSDSTAVILRLIEKKYRNAPKEKVIAAMLRRGFSYPTILDALKSQDSYNKEMGN